MVTAMKSNKMPLNKVTHYQAWEKLTVVNAGNGKVCLKSHHGRYLSAQRNGSLVWDRTWCKGWEQFTVEKHGAALAFKSAHGKYLRAHKNFSMDAKSATKDLFTVHPANCLN